MTNTSQIYKQNNLIMGLLIVTSIRYLVMTGIATVLQGLLERRSGSDALRMVRKGGVFSALLPDRPAREGAMA